MQDNASLEIPVRSRPQSPRWTRRIVVYAVFASCAASLDPAKEAGAIEFSLPIDCTPGQDCVVQNYVDRDPGPGWQDYRCGSLSYDGHNGTDFRVRNLVDLRRGVLVLAAADGAVKALRDGMADSGADGSRQDLAGRECGNGVLLRHGDGWETQYCHLRRGSVRVKKGETVHRGQAIALVGLSGNTEFPHLEFVVRRNGNVRDPFFGETPVERCQAPSSPLWRADVIAQLPYREVTIFGAGFASVKPTMKAVEQGKLSVQTQPADAEAMLVWTRLIGYRPEHRLHIRILDPAGHVLRDHLFEPVDRPKAQWLSWIGVRPGPDGWARGLYLGEITVSRDGQVLARSAVNTLMPQ